MSSHAIYRDNMQIRTLRQRGHQGAEMVRLLELALADLDDVGQVLADLYEQLAADAAFAEEETIQRVLMLGALLLQGLEVLWVIGQYR